MWVGAAVMAGLLLYVLAAGPKTETSSEEEAGTSEELRDSVERVPPL
jgi:hypothetical protein